MAWLKMASLDDLLKQPLVVKHPPLQIALFHVDGRVFAVDNRCPHEGYPLAMGKVSKDCVLTCNWHNWKFKLEDGSCILGGDNVRSYPTRLQNGEVWVDATPQGEDETRRQIFRGLRVAFDDRDFGRICREIARLHYNGLNPRESVKAAIEWSHDRLEYGDTHAYAGAADWLSLADTFSGDFEKQLICTAEAVDHMAYDSRRQPRFPYSPPGEPFERAAFLDAVENQQSARAEGMVSRALAEGRHWADLEEPFAAAAFAHYNDFGHSVIYLQKTGELLNILREQSLERFLLLPLTRELCYAIRDDLIPDFKEYAPVLEMMSESGVPSTTGLSLEVPFPANLKNAFQWLQKSLKTHGVTQIYDALLTALAESLLHYDTEYGTAFDGPVSSSVSWLGFTHGVTFSHATRYVCTKYPQFWRAGLLQMACFLGRNFHYIDTKLDPEPWRVGNPAPFFAEAHERLLDHGINEPIYAVHLLKTTRAVEAELPNVSPECGEALLASLNRFLRSSIKFKHVRRLARQSIALVSRDF
jgi:nitrite reductase/ring-hydroxylating ferredoxin subunit